MAIASGFWFAALVLLPVTTAPFLPLGETVAKPISIVPAAIAFTLAFLFGGRRRDVLLAREPLLLYAFGLSAIFGFGILVLDSPRFVDAGAFIRGLFALAIGIVFYLAFRIMNQTRRELRSSERAILVGLSVSVAVAVLQFVADKLVLALRPVVALVNLALVDVATDWSGRYHGLAYEPSWLASQITVLMLPLLLSRWVTGQTLGVARLGAIMVRQETLFLGVAVIGVVLSASRAAFVSTVVILGIVLLSTLAFRNRAARGLRFPRIAAITVAAAAVILGSLSNNYVYSLVQGFQSKSLVELAEVTSSTPRLSAWVVGLQAFRDNPIVGVGLGNALTHYREDVPAWARESPEVRQWLADPTMHLNPKNMIVKLLAETGLLGFALFAAFVVIHFRNSPRDPRCVVLRNIAAVALLFDYLSLDSFALTTDWFLLGFVLHSWTRTMEINTC